MAGRTVLGQLSWALKRRGGSDSTLHGDGHAEEGRLARWPSEKGHCTRWERALQPGRVSQAARRTRARADGVGCRWTMTVLPAGAVVGSELQEGFMPGGVTVVTEMARRRMEAVPTAALSPRPPRAGLGRSTLCGQAAHVTCVVKSRRHKDRLVVRPPLGPGH